MRGSKGVTHYNHSESPKEIEGNRKEKRCAMLIVFCLAP
jgi:hypothetical protein